MRCMCRNCGTYMVQDEKGLDSRCICPECFAVCSACMGTERTPASLDELKRLYASRAAFDARESEEDDPISPPESRY